MRGLQEVQTADDYAHSIPSQRCNIDHNDKLDVLVLTDALGDWRETTEGGTITYPSITAYFSVIQIQHSSHLQMHF